MKRFILRIALPAIVLLINPGMTFSKEYPVFQDESEELIPSTDSVSIDDMDPIFYEVEEDEELAETKSGNPAKLIIGIVGVVILLGVGYFFIKRSASKE